MAPLTDKPAVKSFDAGGWVHRKVVTLLPGARWLVKPARRRQGSARRKSAGSPTLQAVAGSNVTSRSCREFGPLYTDKPEGLRGAICGTCSETEMPRWFGVHPVHVSTALISESSIAPKARAQGQTTGGLVCPRV